MGEDPRRQNDRWHDLLSEIGRDNFRRLFDAEVRTMANTSSKGPTYRKIRRAAVEFLETHYTEELQFDALIPYMAMTLVDRVHLLGKIPTIVKTSSKDNRDLFFTCCLLFSWELRCHGLDEQSVLCGPGLEGRFNMEDVISMEMFIGERLNWLLLPVMPFRFIHFFALFLTLDPSPSALQPVYQLIVTSQFDIAFTEFRPSVMAFSAMLVYTKKELPNQFDTFKTSVTECGGFAKLQDMIDRCQTKLEPLYRKSTDPTPSDVAGPSKAADDVDDEGPSRRKGKEIVSDDEIECKPDIGSQGRRHNYSADLMSFPLGWKDAQAKADMNDEALILGTIHTDTGKLTFKCNIL